MTDLASLLLTLADRLGVGCALYDAGGRVRATSSLIDDLQLLTIGERLPDSQIGDGRSDVLERLQVGAVAGRWGVAWRVPLTDETANCLVVVPSRFSRQHVFVHLAGGFEVRLGDRVLFQGPSRDKLYELLLVVALGLGRPMSRGTVARALWPNELRPAQRENLKQLLRRLPVLAERMQLPEGVSPITPSPGGGLLLNRDCIRFGLEVLFDAATLAGRRVLAGDELGAARIAEATMLTLFADREGGILEEDIRQTPMLEPYARRLAWTIAQLVLLAGNAMAREGRDRSIVEMMRVALRHAPRAPQIAVIAVHAGLRAGDVGFARKAYVRYARALADPLSWEQVIEEAQQHSLWLAPAA